jgi:hypothetical protein
MPRMIRYPRSSDRLRLRPRHWLDSSHTQRPVCPRDIPCHTGLKNGTRALPSLLYAMSSEASERFPELLGSHQSPGSRFFQHFLELRPLPSTSITWLPRYYGPFRHPKRPGLSLAGFQLKNLFPIESGFPCCARPPFTCMPSPLPRRERWACSLIYPSTCGLPCFSARSAPVSPFSRPARRLLPLRPACSQNHLK